MPRDVSLSGGVGPPRKKENNQTKREVVKVEFEFSRDHSSCEMVFTETVQHQNKTDKSLLVYVRSLILKVGPATATNTGQAGSASNPAQTCILTTIRFLGLHIHSIPGVLSVKHDQCTGLRSTSEESDSTCRMKNCTRST